MAVGAFDGDTLVGFGVLAYQWRGDHRDYGRVAEEARKRGAKYLFISSTDTRSAVSFYKSNGSQLTDDVDPELFQKEPKDIHMLLRL
jgi:hypothetical protein